MNRKRGSTVSLGPGAPSLILIFVILSMSVLGILALMKARNDLNLSLRAAEVAETVYALNDAAEDTRRDVERLVNGCYEEVARRSQGGKIEESERTHPTEIVEETGEAEGGFGDLLEYRLAEAIRNDQLPDSIRLEWDKPQEDRDGLLSDGLLPVAVLSDGDTGRTDGGNVLVVNGTVSWEENGDHRQLECALRLWLTKDGVQTGWVKHRLVTGLSDEGGDFWD